jgi:hypothetical protein
MASVAQGAAPLGYRGIAAPCLSDIFHPRVSKPRCGGSRFIPVPDCARTVPALPPPARRRVVPKDVTDYTCMNPGISPGGSR